MVHLTTALDPASAVPLYEQLYRSLAAEMRAGTLTAGTRMPGKRRLAAELSVSVNTVDTAYQMLAAEGYLTARERSGFTVQEYLALPQGTQPPAAPSAPTAVHPADTAPPVQFDLSTRGVDPGLFPFRTWARLQKELLYSAPELLTPGDARGDAALRQALPVLHQAAQQALYKAHSPQTARLKLERLDFAPRDYGNFALPGGRYTALRVELGEGKGHNWFCVLYPALCVSGAQAKYPSQAENALVFGRYEVRFAVVDAVKNWIQQ